MLKKTTVYLSVEDLLLLRKKATILHVTVAEAIRLSIKEACQPKTKEEKAIWESLDRVWAKTSGVDSKEIHLSVDKAVKGVRRSKVRHRS